MAKEHEKNSEFKASTSKNLLCQCEHKDSKVSYCVLGLCETCFKHVLKASNSAYKRQEKELLAAALERDDFESEYSKDDDNDDSHRDDDSTAEAQDESESFSDIDDEEVDGYLLNEEERHYRQKTWENQYQEYYEEMKQRQDQM